MKSLARLGRRSQAGIAALALVAGTVALAPAQAAPAVQGTNVLRLVSPVLNNTNSLDLSFDAPMNGWDIYYGKGLKFYFFYQNVGSSMSMTWQATNAAGAPLAGRTVYLIVNKYGSCSDTKFTTTNPMQYGNPTDGAQIALSNQGVISRDWCGDDAGGHPQWGSGESSLSGTTNAQGLVTFNLTNTNNTFEAEPAPASLTTKNPYAPRTNVNPYPCADTLSGVGCLATTITASLVQHPQTSDDRTEDKDLLNIHYVNNAVTNDVTTATVALTTPSKSLGFTVTNLAGVPQSGVKLNFSNITGIGTLSAESATTDGTGYATVSVSPDCADAACAGQSKVKATVDGTTSSAQSTVIWSNSIPSPTPTPTPATKPSASKAASVSGTAKVGKSLLGGKGTWTGAPTYAYKWYACSASGTAKTSVPSGCTAITGATSTSFKLTTKQKGKYIRFGVTARNAGGSTVSVSAASAKVS